MAVLALVASGVSLIAQARGVELIPRDAERRVDVNVDGEPFTAYIWPDGLKKPVLYPIRSAKGTPVTRGFPLDPRPGERVDHPHHVGLWFNYGNVNGVDFWNNSDAIAADRRGQMGTVVHRDVTAAEGGATRGELRTLADWTMPDGTVVLAQSTTYVFAGSPTERQVDLTITLAARERPVSFADNKEGLLGLRVARALEAPADKPEIFTDREGRPSAVPALDNEGVSGEYLTSEGVRGQAVWGTRGRWCRLEGRIGAEVVSLALLDHPRNIGFPTYWHARGYGLFAANPLGQKELSGGKEALNFSLAPLTSVTFRYRLIVWSGPASSEQIERAWRAWAQAP
jgi:hypothetical protein